MREVWWYLRAVLEKSASSIGLFIERGLEKGVSRPLRIEWYVVNGTPLRFPYLGVMGIPHTDWVGPYWEYDALYFVPKHRAFECSSFERFFWKWFGPLIAWSVRCWTLLQEAISNGWGDDEKAVVVAGILERRRKHHALAETLGRSHSK